VQHDEKNIYTCHYLMNKTCNKYMKSLKKSKATKKNEYKILILTKTR